MRFASDNAGPVHPKVMEALQIANEGWAMPYGNDDLTASAVARVREIFEAPEAAVYLVATGTAANALLLATLAQPTDTVFCTHVAHIEQDECNAPEFFTGGAKLTLIDSPDGLMEPDKLAHAVERLGAVHGPQPGALSITQVTECGTLYTLEQIEALTAVAKRHNIPNHMDGARFANAIAALGCSPAEMTWKRGVDAVSFGGTKNGLMGVEAAVIFDPALAWTFELRRKRGAHLFSKNRYLAAQMDAYLTDDLWLNMASAANDGGQKLAQALGANPEVRFDHTPQANMLFASFPRSAHQRLNAAGAAYYRNGPLDGDPDTMLSARMVVDWSCPDQHIDDFVSILRG